MKLPMVLLWTKHFRPRCPSFERAGGNVPALRRPWLLLRKWWK